jgi:D-beta-D-heptose 7-phosphate kinase/D-beta-D-heptose 1-phosphate adenosyltransferase
MIATASTQAEDLRDKILIIGDLIIDRTWYVKCTKLSPEAPVPVATLKTPEPIETPGGAGLAAAYSAKHDIPSIFFTAATDMRRNWLNGLNIKNQSVLTDSNVIKTRYIENSSGYHLLRVDNDNTVGPVHDSSQRGLVNIIEAALATGEIGTVAMLDYRKGLFSNLDMTQQIIAMCDRRGIPTYIDSRDKDLRKFYCANWMKLNKFEFKAAKSALGIHSGAELIEKLGLIGLVVTLGRKGATVYDDIHPGGVNVQNLNGVFPNGTPDVTGCGDVFDMSFCYNWGILGHSPVTAATAAVEAATKFAWEPFRNRLV